MAAINECTHCHKPVYVHNEPVQRDIKKLNPTENPFRYEIVVTTCGHVFDRHCLALWLQTQDTCPIDSSRITLDECKPFASILNSFAATYQPPKSLASTPRPPNQVDSGEICSICLGDYEEAYYVHNQGFLHLACCKEKSPAYPKYFPSKIALEELQRRKPFVPPAAPVVFLAILFPMSIWALAMNWRFYKGRNVVLFVLSIPALLIYKTFSLLFTVLRKVLLEKPA